MKKLSIGFGVTGSHCTFQGLISPLQLLKEQGHSLTPILSQATAATNTRFGDFHVWRRTFEELCQCSPLDTISAVEEMTGKFDIVVVAPCTGNTLAKLANAITDTPVAMAVKAQLRNERPVVLSISTNDGLGGNAVNIGRLLDKRCVYFVPFCQDNPKDKPRSLVSRLTLLPQTIESALQGLQIQPLLDLPVQQ